MTHIIGIMEGFEEGIKNFIDYFHGKTYAEGKAKVRVRTMIPINFSINKEGREEFLKDLKMFESNGKNYTGKEKDGRGAKSKTIKLINWVKKLFPMIKNIDKEYEEIPKEDYTKLQVKIKKPLKCNFYLAGEIPDRFKEGKEVV